MKKNIILFLLLFALGISFVSCSKDFENGLDYNGSNINGNEGTGTIPEAGIFKATIAGEAFVANSTTAIVTDDYVNITGFRTSKGDLIQIVLPGNKIGTYTWENSEKDGEKFVLAYTLNTNEYAFVSASSEVAEFLDIKNYTDTAIIKITAVDKTKKTISGTFQFTGFRESGDDSTEVKVITNGSFANIIYTENLPVEEPDHSLKTKIDGVDIAEDQIDVTIVSTTGVYPYYSIVGSHKGDNNDSVRIGINKSYSVGTYMASSVLLNNDGGIVSVVSASCTIDDLLYTSESGSIIITLKTATQLEGTFNFTVSNFSTGNKKTIRGSFSINTEDLD